MSASTTQVATSKSTEPKRRKRFSLHTRRDKVMLALLLGIRSRGTYARVLAPMTEREQSFWEGANYVVALLALVVIGILWNARRRNEQPIQLTMTNDQSRIMNHE